LIAEKHLTPPARAAVERLLAIEPGSTMASISTWPDEHRNRITSRWHFVNFPRGDCHFRSERDCSDGQCVVAAIEKQNRILHSDASDAKRLTALKYLVHFVGDSHQPLHAGFSDDKGGNEYQVHTSGKSRNLHALWDTGLFLEIAPDSTSLSTKIMKDESRVIVSFGTGPVQWAEESCRIVQSNEFYPPHKVPDSYFSRFAPVAELQIYRAGVRLADMLNDLQ